MSTPASLQRTPLPLRTVVRFVASLLYVVGTILWMVFMLFVAGLRCDDACTAPAYQTSWTDNVHAWQYGVVGWLGVAGVALALLVVVVADFFGRAVAAAVLAAHVCVFAVNAFVLLHGSGVYKVHAGVVAAVLGAAACGVVSVYSASRRKSRTT